MSRLIAVMLGVLLSFTVAPPVNADEPCWGWRCRSINAIRANHGVKPLVQGHGLQRKADAWAEELARSGVLRHNPDIGDYRWCYRAMGENVGYGPDWRTIKRAYMDSPPHRANILDRDYDRLGIGTARSSDGRVWNVLVFRDRCR